MSTISIKQAIGKGYDDAWFTNCQVRYRCFVGGRSTKKSVDIGGYEPIFKIIMDSNRNIIMSRKDDVNNSSSTYPNIVNLIHKLGLSEYFKCKVSPYEIIYKPTGQKIVFKGCNNPEAITSTKFVVGELTDIYFEEASELTSYDDFRKIDGSVRPLNSFPQITFMMNGWDKKSWIYDVFWKDRLEDNYEYLEHHDYMDYLDDNFNLGYGFGLYLHKSTFRINEFRDEYKDASMEILKQKAFEIYKVEGLGCWGNTSDVTYLYWNDNLIIPHYQVANMDFSSITIGVDIGAGNGEGKMVKNTKDRPNRYRSAMTMCISGVTADYEKNIVLNEWFYSNQDKEIKQGSPEIAENMVKEMLKWREMYRLWGTIVVYVESADPGGFRTLLEAKAKEMGLYNARFIASTKNRIQTRVDWENLLMAMGDFLVSNTCINLIREIKNARAAEDGSPREDIDDHTINAYEYSSIPTWSRIRRWKEFKEH